MNFWGENAEVPFSSMVFSLRAQPMIDDLLGVDLLSCETCYYGSLLVKFDVLGISCSHECVVEPETKWD